MCLKNTRHKRVNWLTEFNACKIVGYIVLVLYKYITRTYTIHTLTLNSIYFLLLIRFNVSRQTFPAKMFYSVQSVRNHFSIGHYTLNWKEKETLVAMPNYNIKKLRWSYIQMTLLQSQSDKSISFYLLNASKLTHG